MSDQADKPSKGTGPTIREVAKKAGVSIKTVSRMLSGAEGVRDETRRRIQKVMDGLEYYPSAAARSLRGQKTGLIAFITDSLTTTPDSFEIVKGVQTTCAREGRLLMIGETNGDAEALNRLVVEFRRQRPDAVLMASMSHTRIVVEHSFATCPLVLVNCFEADNRFLAVVPDDYGGALDATRRMLELGHRRIGHLGLDPETIATKLRLDGYVQAHREKGMPVDEALVCVDASQAEGSEFVQLPAIIDRMLNLPDPPTVLMCGNDKMALRTLLLLHAKGLHVPDDISLVGFDDYKVISENLLPQLTTVALPYFEMGVRAAELAMKPAHPKRILSPCRVVERDSTRAVGA